jgi:hypothetical protein
MSCNNSSTNVHNLSSTGSKKIIDTKKQKISSILYDIATSPDPEQFAKDHGIFLDMGRVRVFISFDASTSDQNKKNILNEHKIMVEKSAAHMIRGLVTVDQLIPLSGEPGVRSIRLPDKLIKAKEINP